MKEHILVVDDDLAVQAFVAEVLRDAGYGVGMAEDGEAAWDALCTDYFDILVTDHNMPKLTGLELLQRVRAGPRDLLPVIMISGNVSFDEAALVRLLQPGRFLQKPFSSLVLLATVRELLARRADADTAGADLLSG